MWKQNNANKIGPNIFASHVAFHACLSCRTQYTCTWQIMVILIMGNCEYPKWSPPAGKNGTDSGIFSPVYYLRGFLYSLTIDVHINHQILYAQINANFRMPCSSPIPYIYMISLAIYYTQYSETQMVGWHHTETLHTQSLMPSITFMNP